MKNKASILLENPLYIASSPLVQNSFLILEDSINVQLPVLPFPERKTFSRYCTKNLGDRCN